MFRLFILVLFVFWLPISVFGAFPVPTSFLKMGDYSDEVVALQKILNLDEDTKVSETGPGSLGNETRYFGPATKKAVIKFQEKYKNDVLLPAGLSMGTGYVGSLTLVKIKNIAQNGVAVSKPSSPLINFGGGAKQSPVVEKNGNKISFREVSPNSANYIWSADKWYEDIGKKATALAKESVTSGQEINLGLMDFVNGAPKVSLFKSSAFNFIWGKDVSVSGSGFDRKNNKIYFSDKYFIEDVGSNDGGTISFKMPEIPKGHYKLIIVSSLGPSNSLPIFVSKYESSPVVINSITPQNISIGEVVKIEGKGFTQNNDLNTSFGVIKNVPSSDGTTISVKIDPDSFAEYKKINKKFDKIWNVSVYVSNENGISENPGFFDLSI